MPAPCGVPLGLCAMRLTRLLETGCVDGSTDNSFVSTELISLQFTPVVETGADTTLTGGCDCTIASSIASMPAMRWSRTHGRQYSATR